MAFPATLEILDTNRADTTATLTTHPADHNNENRILNELMAKIGVDSSAVTTSHDYKLSGITGSDKAASKTGTETLTNKTLTSPVLTNVDSTDGTLTTPTIDAPIINDATFTNPILINSANTDFGTMKGVTTGTSNGLFLGTCRNSLSSPTATQSGDDLMVFKAIGYGATGWSSSRGVLNMEATQNWTDSAQGTRFIISTTPNDSTTAAEGFRVSNNGIVAFAKSAKRYSASSATKTSNTTVMDVANLTFDVSAAASYVFYANLHCTAGASGGIKAAVNGTCTATAIVYDVICSSGTSMAITRSTALGTTGGITAANPFVKIEGTITVNAAGTLKIEFAQNASNGTASTIVIGSVFHIEQLLN